MGNRQSAIGIPFLLFLACLAAAAVLFLPCIGLHTTIYGRDTVSHDYGMALWAWGLIRSTGRLPLWNPYLFGGIPTLGSFAVCPFAPSAVFFAVLPFPLAFTLQYLCAFAIGGTGMALLARRLGLGFLPSLAAGLVFTLSGHFTTLAYAGHLTKALAFAWIPWLFLAAEKWHEQKRWRDAALMAIPLALMLTASHFQIAWLAVFFLAIWLIGKAVFESMKAGEDAGAPRAAPSEESNSCANMPEVSNRAGLGAPASSPASSGRFPSRPRIGVLLSLPLVIAQFLFALALAAALGAIQVLPGLEMAPISNRAEGVSYEEAAQTSYPPEELLEYVIPGFFGSKNAYFGRWGAPSPERIVSDYFGLGALFLAAFGLVFSKRKSKWLWAVIAASGIVIGLGSFTPLFAFLRAAAPGFASFRSPAVAMGWTTVGGVVLTAYGLEELLALRIVLRERRSAWRRAWFALSIVLVVAAIALLVLAPTAPEGLLDEDATGRYTPQELMRGFRMIILGIHLMILALFVVLLARSVKRRAGVPMTGPRRVLLAAWLALLAVDVAGHSRRYVQTLFQDSYEYHAKTAAPAAVLAE
ncbi:MAG: 6-pyruvoyl-tetrahydropterin synthase-related protein, partial [Candidatus Sumerlaeota bacterium]|nr:6-pyruvoyl-tetrahydropterin synthase-related protein [Candidatus Sumerlaeota bacterium]